MIDAKGLQQGYGIVSTLEAVIDEQDIRTGRQFEQLVDLMIVDGAPRNQIGDALRQMRMGFLIGQTARKTSEVRLDPWRKVALYIIVADIDAIIQQPMELLTATI